MGCFLGCFGSSKDDSKRRKDTQIASHRNPDLRNYQYNPVSTTPTFPANQEILKQPLNFPVPKSCVKVEEKEQLSFYNKDKPEEQLSPGKQKKVTFDSNVKSEEQLSSGTRKKVTFDSSVKSEEQLSSGAQKKVTFNSNVKLEEHSSSGSREHSSSGSRKKVTFDSNVREYEHISYGEPPQVIMQESEQGGEKVVDEKPTKSLSVSEDGSTLSSLVSFPPNHRYQNCRESDDEAEELDYEVSDFDEDEDDDEEVYDDGDDEYSDDEFHLRQVQEFSVRSCSSVESRTKSSGNCFIDDKRNDLMLDHESSEIGTKTPVGFNRGARDRSGYVHSVLNPVENTAQWKSVKVKGTAIKKEQKENFLADLGFQQSLSKTKPKLDEPKNYGEVAAVNASLSTWLVSSQKTPSSKATPVSLESMLSGASASSHGSNSVRSQEERPILGALTVDELKQFSATSSPIRSPTRSPDERPLVGTVGVHWNDRTPVEGSGSVSSFKGIPNTTSKYREDKRVSWHSTPFETRLERALNRGSAEGHSSSHVLII